MQKGGERDDPPALLLEIARTIGVSVDAFSSGPDKPIAVPKSDPLEQEIIWLFRTLQSDQDRQRCVALLRAIASTAAKEGSDPSEDKQP